MHHISSSHFKRTLLSSSLFAYSLALSSFAFSLEASRPHVPKPEPWHPAKVLVFGDSLSDSNGDSFRSPDTAHSTYNLLRTLRGDTITLPDGTTRRPMNLDELMGKRSTIDNIRANFDLMVKEIRREGMERGYIGRMMSNVHAGMVQNLGSVINLTLTYMDKTEDHIDERLLTQLNRVSHWLTRKVHHATPGSLAYDIFSSLSRQVHYVINFVERDMSDSILDFGNDKLIEITSKFPDVIPVVPDPEYYATGKWTTGTELDQVWVEVLYKMMSDQTHTVKLDNRAMAGSWTLCAADKVESLHVVKDLTDSMMPGATMLVEGSMIPPCEGLIVQSYLNERRNIYQKENGHTPDFGDQLIEKDTLVVFLNSANDFLNLWSDPNDVAQEHARDIWHILSAGAKRVAVVLLPDISDTPRFYPDRSKPKSQEARHLSNLIQHYNTSLRMRLQLLREEFDGDYGYQVMTIDGDRIFKELQAEERWDLTNPILDIEVPGMSNTATTPNPEPKNFVTEELLKNHDFDDNWHITGIKAELIGGKVPFFADSVHPSAEAHYALAVKACRIMQDDFNIPCSEYNYTREQAMTDKKPAPHAL